MQSTLSESEYRAISQRYPESPTFEQFVELFTEFAYHEFLASKGLKSSFHWEFVLPRVARSSVRKYCRRTGMRPPNNYAAIVSNKLSLLCTKSNFSQSLAMTG